VAGLELLRGKSTELTGYSTIVEQWGCEMTKIDQRTAANMDVVLEESFQDLPHGGNHETRKRNAQKLMQCAKKGNVTLDGLRTVANRALSELSSRKSA